MSANASIKPKTVSIPDIPALCLGTNRAYVMTPDGELEEHTYSEIQSLYHQKPLMVCHAPFVRNKIPGSDFHMFDALELYAFVHPVRFTIPTVSGLAKSLELSPPGAKEDMPFTLMQIVKALLEDIQKDPHQGKADPAKIAHVMGANGKSWPWTSYILEALGEQETQESHASPRRALNIWRDMPEWSEDAPPPPPSHHGVNEQETQDRMQKLLGAGSEQRETQRDYANEIAGAFAPVQENQDPHVVLAEAGTGVGKTLGYLASASVWSEKNDATVWISTYTKNLQRQIDQELSRLYPNPAIKDVNVTIRKGRENYLCLLNLEEKVNGVETARTPRHVIAAGLMARWAAATKDGDLSGIDFPGWLVGLLGYEYTGALADRRGECIYSACDHYHRCFVEKSVRRARRAKIVVANHALAMINTVIAGPNERLPARYIFDEGHHLFDAADSAFSAHLTGRETRDLRRWILGNEGGKRTRARGLQRRIEDLIVGDTQAEKALQDLLFAARALSAEGWTRRLKDGKPSGPTETFLHLVYAQVTARALDKNSPYSIETPTRPLIDDILPAAEKLRTALMHIQKPMTVLCENFKARLDNDEGTMDGDTRKRLDALASSLKQRGQMTLLAWINMLDTLKDGQTPPDLIDWMEIERNDGRAIDVGLYRHFINPMSAFANTLKPHLHGMAVTSATLRDGSADWDQAITRTGANLLTPAPKTGSYSSPFDYASQTRVFIINDVRKTDLGQVSGAYQALFKASQGGALGLFTAIQRLKAVHGKIKPALEEAELALYSQHIDEIDSGTLVDMFREDTHACLLGTDAIRDGVDVPGESLRLIVFDRVPWPRPTLLHKARREAFGGRRYDEMITRLKLKQAFGRLIRRAGDKGVFVMLDSMLPSRLHDAFPEDTPVIKTDLSDAIQNITAFLQNDICELS